MMGKKPKGIRVSLKTFKQENKGHSCIFHVFVFPFMVIFMVMVQKIQILAKEIEFTIF